ncbi:MAG TPA: universal stress protein [Polyangiaceae bacterium]|jgi:nucleotide-binding universal stress UspA family protein
MATPTRILVATDFSEASKAAFDYAVDLAKALGAKVTALHVYELPVYGFPSGTFVAPPELAVEIMTAAEDSMKRACAAYATSGVDVTKVVQQGTPWEEVHRVAEEVGAELIVIGTHGRRGLSHALLGSVAEKIIRTATRPVLTIHAAKAR